MKYTAFDDGDEVDVTVNFDFSRMIDYNLLKNHIINSNNGLPLCHFKCYKNVSFVIESEKHIVLFDIDSKYFHLSTQWQVNVRNLCFCSFFVDFSIFSLCFFFICVFYF